MRNHASYGQWADAYQRAYLAPGTVSALPCPNCGSRSLHLVFVTRGQPERGQAAFWCGNCLNGVLMAPCPIPDYAERTDPETAHIPDYALVPPGTVAEDPSESGQ